LADATHVVQVVKELKADDAKAQALAVAASRTMTEELTPDIVREYWKQVCLSVYMYVYPSVQRQ
jgi:hypothetical protein